MSAKTPEAIWNLYNKTWQITDVTARQALFDTCLDPAVQYTDPLAQTRGLDELAAYMAAFHEQVPGGHFKTTYFQSHHGRCVAKWDMLDDKGVVCGEGVSFGTYAADGRLKAMTGFFEVPTQP